MNPKTTLRMLALAPWLLGALARWRLDALAPWHLGTLAPCSVPSRVAAEPSMSQICEASQGHFSPERKRPRSDARGGELPLIAAVAPRQGDVE